MTGYHLELGYDSHRGAPQMDEAWETLKVVVEGLRHKPGLITDEAARERDRSELREYADSYVPTPGSDLTIKIIEPENGQRGQVMQLASGGGISRDIKEQLRRAFCRLVIFEMHKRGIEVNLVVA